MSEVGQNGPERAAAGRHRKGAVDAAAVSLAAGKSVVDAAAAAGVGRRTLTRWLAIRKFRDRVNELRARAVGEAIGRLSTSMSAAADVLGALLRNRNPAVKLRAARAVLELATKLRESEELERRVTELEARRGGEK